MTCGRFKKIPCVEVFLSVQVLSDTPFRFDISSGSHWRRIGLAGALVHPPQP